MRAKLREEVVVTMSVPEAQALLQEFHRGGPDPTLDWIIFHPLITALDSVLNAEVDHPEPAR